MSKSITVSSVAYVHTDDVDPEKHLSAIPINEAMNVAIVRVINALENPTGAYTDFQRATMQTCLRSAQSTHAAIRKVLSWGEEDPMSVDALALARLPLESLYNMCMFTESPDWVDVYVRDGWKKQYEQFLLQREETKKLKRYDEYSNKKGPHHLAAVGKTIGITKVQVATIEHEQLGTPMPSDSCRTTFLSSRLRAGRSTSSPRTAISAACSNGSIRSTFSSAHSRTGCRTRICSR